MNLRPSSGVAQRKASPRPAGGSFGSGPAEDWTRVVVRPDIHSTPVQRKAGGGSAQASGSASASGSALPGDVQAKMESSFGGTDFSSVRVHEGSQATQMGALAYTQGTDIHFAPGQYQPNSQSGQELLGHELTHVVQQSQGRVQATTQAKGAPVNDDASLEREADEMGARAARGDSAMGTESTSVAGAGSQSPAQYKRASGSSPIQMAESTDTSATTGPATGTGSDTEVTPGSATVVGAAADSEYAFDNSFTPALVQALQSNPNLSLDEVLQNISANSLGQPALDNDNALHHPTILQYGQTDANTTECRDNQKVAVLIPNQNYVNINPLSTPIAEANSMSSELQGRGYDANVHADKSSAEMSTLWNGMVNAANQGDDLVAFYGGHGAPEGLCGINDDLPPNPSDIFTNAQVEGVVSSATARGAHIRFIMDSCHSGSAVQTVREERQNELAQNADSLGDGVRVLALQGLTAAKQRLLDHVHERERVLDQMDSAIRQHQGLEPDPANADAHSKWSTILTGLRNSRNTVQTAFDQKADAIWSLLKPVLYVVKFTSGHAEAPPDITDYRTLGAQVNYLDDLWNTCSQPMERDLANQQQGSGS